jgi:hypothetical protein
VVDKDDVVAAVMPVLFAALEMCGEADQHRGAASENDVSISATCSRVRANFFESSIWSCANILRMKCEYNPCRRTGGGQTSGGT